MSIELNDNEVECVELMEDQSVRLCDLEALLPALMNKYGNKAVLRFGGVVIAPTKGSKVTYYHEVYCARRIEMQVPDGYKTMKAITDAYKTGELPCANPRRKSNHQVRVEEFMEKAGQELPQTPTIPSEEVRLLRAKLILEEALETIYALGFSVEDFSERVSYSEVHIHAHAFGPEIQEVVDGCCDIKVVTTGTLSAFGIADEGPQEAVDESNLAKFKPPMCSECGEEMRFGRDETFGEFYFCMNPSAKHGHRRVSVTTTGCYKREDGKFIKPVDWQPPNWDAILKEQGYLFLKPVNDAVLGEKFLAVPIVDETVVPVGPGDGLYRRRPDEPYHFTAYKGHLCPECKTPLSDGIVSRMCIAKQRWQCPECRRFLSIDSEPLNRPVVVLY